MDTINFTNKNENVNKQVFLFWNEERQELFLTGVFPQWLLSPPPLPNPPPLKNFTWQYNLTYYRKFRKSLSFYA